MDPGRAERLESVADDDRRTGWMVLALGLATFASGLGLIALLRSGPLEVLGILLTLGGIAFLGAMRWLLGPSGPFDIQPPKRPKTDQERLREFE